MCICVYATVRVSQIYQQKTATMSNSRFRSNEKKKNVAIQNAIKA